MEPTRVTCTRVEEEDLDTRYLAGTLSEEEAEAFEEHYFACERCWSKVQLGLGVRAAETEPGAREDSAPFKVERGSGRSLTSTITRRRWVPLAIAASVAIIAIGLWQQGDRGGVVPNGEVLRGPTDSIQAVAFVRGRMLIVSWPAKPNADRYGVRLQKSDGSVVIERIVADTSLAISRDSIATVADGENVYWEVRALDALRRTIARSRLIPAPMPSRRR